jgi:hypothetical protein
VNFAEAPLFFSDGTRHTATTAISPSSRPPLRRLPYFLGGYCISGEYIDPVAHVLCRCSGCYSATTASLDIQRGHHCGTSNAAPTIPSAIQRLGSCTCTCDI